MRLLRRGGERLKGSEMKEFKDIVGLFGGASSKCNGIRMIVSVNYEMKDSFGFEDLGKATKLCNGIGGNGCRVHSNKFLY